MASKTKLIIEYEFDTDVNNLYENFYDFRKYGQLHPFMTDVKVIEDKSPDYIEYSVCEELRLLGLIKYCPSYNVKVIEKSKYKHIIYTSQVKKGVFLTMNLYFTEDNGKTKFKEDIEVEGNKIIVSVFLKIVKNAHDKLYTIMQQRLARSN